MSSQPSLATAAEADAWNPHLIVLATVSDLDSAQREAERASALLGYGIDKRSYERPEEPRQAEGALVSVQRTRGGFFEIVCCLTNEVHLEERLTSARQFFPTAQTRSEPHGMEAFYLPFVRRGVVVAGSYPSYDSAVQAGEELEAASGIPLGTRGLVYDDADGLTRPDSQDGDPSHGFYMRRYDRDCFAGPGLDEAPCLTIEPSEAYDGFEPGLFILVAGVLGRGPERDERLRTLREFVPDSYVKETNIWMGCIH